MGPRWLVRVAVLGLAALLLWRLRVVWVPFVLALILAYLIEPVVGLLERREVPRGVAILVVYLIIGLVGSFLWLYAAPAILRDVQELVARLPEQTRQIQQQATEILSHLRVAALPLELQGAVAAALQRLEGLLAGFVVRLADLLLALLSQVLNLVLAPVLAYYILKDRERLAAGLLRAVPPEWRPVALRAALEMDRALAAVVRGQLLVSFTIGAVVAAGLALLKVRYALLLGFITGLLDIIPYFGPVAAGVPIVVAALMKGPLTAVWAVVLLVAANQVESLALHPRIMSGSTGLHPITVIASVLAGAELAGIVGMLVAVPVAAVARSLWLAFGSGADGLAPAGAVRPELPAAAARKGAPPKPGPH